MMNPDSLDTVPTNFLDENSGALDRMFTNKRIADRISGEVLGNAFYNHAASTKAMDMFLNHPELINRIPKKFLDKVVESEKLNSGILVRILKDRQIADRISPQALENAFRNHIASNDVMNVFLDHLPF